MKKVILLIILSALISGIIYFYHFSAAAHIFNKQDLVNHLMQFRNSPDTPAFFMLLCITGSLVLPVSLFMLTAGALFGAKWGFVYCFISANISAALAFYIGRYFGRGIVKSMRRFERWKGLDESIKRSGFWAVFRARLVPIAPFNVFNLLAGMSALRFSVFFLGTMIGMLPGIFLYAYFADVIVWGTERNSANAYLIMGLSAACLLWVSVAPGMIRRGKQDI